MVSFINNIRSFDTKFDLEDDCDSTVSSISVDSMKFRIRMMVNSSPWTLSSVTLSHDSGPPTEIVVVSRRFIVACGSSTNEATETFEQGEIDENSLTWTKEVCRGTVGKNFRQDVPFGVFLASDLPLQPLKYHCRRKRRFKMFSFRELKVFARKSKYCKNAIEIRWLRLSKMRSKQLI